MALTSYVTVACDATAGDDTCARKHTTATTDPSKALDAARRNGWHIGLRHYCPTHRHSGGRL